LPIGLVPCKHWVTLRRFEHFREDCNKEGGKMQKLLFALGVVGTTLMVGSASAQPFATHGTVAVGAEHLFGLEYVSSKESMAGIEDKNSSTSLSLLGHAGIYGDTMSLNSALPRLSADVFLGPGVSVGGALMYQHLSFDNPASTGSTTSSSSGANLLLFAPRVGFGARLTDNIAIWPRLGITYLHVWSNSSSVTTNPGTGETLERKGRGTTNDLFLTLDAMMVVSPVEHAAFTFGPTLDYLLSVSSTTDGVGNPTPDTTMYAIGIQAGILFWF
jgi:hypothetical protein